MGYILIAVFLGIIPSVIADNKGYNRWIWWLFGAALFIIALPVAILLPAKQSAIESKETALGKIQCPYCAEFISSQAKICRFCSKEIPPNTFKVPKVISKRKHVLGYVIGILIIIMVVPFILGIVDAMTGSEYGKNYVNELNGNPYGQVARDAVTQYEIASRHGSLIDRCTQAAFVVAAYLQAKDENNYQKWKAIQRNDCMTAGVPAY